MGIARPHTINLTCEKSYGLSNNYISNQGGQGHRGSNGDMYLFTRQYPREATPLISVTQMTVMGTRISRGTAAAAYAA